MSQACFFFDKWSKCVSARAAVWAKPLGNVLLTLDWALNVKIRPQKKIKSPHHLCFEFIWFLSILMKFSEDFFHGASVSVVVCQTCYSLVTSNTLPFGWVQLICQSQPGVGSSSQIYVQGQAGAWEGIFYLALYSSLLHSLGCQNQSDHETELLLQQQSLLRHQESLFSCLFTKLHTLKWSSKAKLRLLVDLYHFC